MVSHIRSGSDDLLLDQRVRALLAAAAAPTEPGPVPGEDEVVAAFRASRHRTRRIPMLGRLTPARSALAATIGAGAFLVAGVGAAAAGTLPGAAQDTARDWLATVGIEVPGADSHAAGHADERGGSDATDTETQTTDEGTGTDAPAAANHGQDVSGLARDTEAEGADKGAVVSDTASAGRSKAGDEHAAHGTRPDDAGDEAETPDTEGADTAGEAADEDGDAATGSDEADKASGGRSTEGGTRR